MDITQQLTGNQLLLLITGNLNFSDSVIKVSKKFSGKRVCFVTLNKTYPSVAEWLESKKVDTKNFFFIDAVSGIIMDVRRQDQRCHFISAPSALTELSIKISEAMKKNPDYLVFDSVSTLSIYNKRTQVERFLSSIIHKISATDTKGLFFILKDDPLITTVTTFVDTVLDVSSQ